MDTPLLRRFLWLLMLFPSNRLMLDAFVGPVLCLFLGISPAIRIHSASLSKASFLFRSCVLNLLAFMIRIPLLVILPPAIRIIRAFKVSEREGEFITSKRSWTAVATLFTCCPPGPEA